MKTLRNVTLTLFLVLLFGLILHRAGGKTVVEPAMRCKVPERFEGHVEVEVKTTGNALYSRRSLQLMTAEGAVHFDRIGKRMVLDEHIHVAGRTIKARAYLREGYMYVAIPSLGTCVKNPSKISFDLVSDLSSTDEIKISCGAFKGVPVQVQEQVGTVPRSPELPNGATYAVHAGFAQPKCLPAFGDIYIRTGSTRQEITERFSDMKEGLADMSVFDLPEYCKQQEENDLYYHHGANRIHKRHLDEQIQHIAIRHHAKFNMFH